MINPRSAINFFKTPAGAFLLFCVVLAVIFFACKRFLPGATKPPPLIYSTKAAADRRQQADDANFSKHKLFAIAESSTGHSHGDDGRGFATGIGKACQSCPAKTGGVTHQPVCRDAAIGTKVS